MVFIILLSLLVCLGLIITELVTNNISVINKFERPLSEYNASKLTYHNFTKLIHSGSIFNKNVLINYLDDNTGYQRNILFFYANWIFEKSLRIYKQNVSPKQTKLAKLEYEGLDICTGSKRQALAIFSLENLNQLSSFKGELKLEIEENQIIFRFTKKSYFLSNDFYNLMVHILKRFLSTQPLDDLIVENAITSCDNKIRLMNLTFLLNNEIDTINKLQYYKDNYPTYYTIIVQQFEKENLGSALTTILEKKSLQSVFFTYHPLLELFDQQSLKRFLNKLKTFSLEDSINSFIVSECDSGQEANHDSLISLLYNKEISINTILNDNTPYLLTRYLGAFKMKSGLNWLITQISFANQDWTSLVLESIRSIGDHQAISLLTQIIKNHKISTLYLGSNKAIIQDIENTIKAVEDIVPQGGLSLTDLGSSGGLSITQSESRGELSIAESEQDCDI